MRWLGHATTLIADRGTVVLTDPVLTPRVAHLRRRRGLPPTGPHVFDPDVVVLSHLHADHTHLPSLRMIADDVPIVVPRRAPDAVPALRAVGSRLIEVEPGDTVQIGGVTIRAVPAAHDGRRWRRGPHTTAALGYVVSGDSQTYFAGDTDVYPDLGQWVAHADLALLPVGGWGPTLGAGHMDPQRAVLAAQTIGARRTVPIHYGTLWPIGMDSVRPGKFFGPGADFVRRARRDGLDVCELLPGDYLGGQFRT
ncbi:MBL fold metallo-hydrolase [Aldersonia sp. NBC_00410]|uniref:MBL fold metallo-hydrolase n=1 Tax=Aldersonia sp. NBC_00410 TaxID=2975954 RepID=UPI0022570BBD|nr:MBL fold metallo-hydrolase [Aldersonia sp. NBC_00410]MCX5041589.1 MBL fold metallo-hydrolase [Aldersonia sp. NBC_00410]